MLRGQSVRDSADKLGLLYIVMSSQSGTIRQTMETID